MIETNVEVSKDLEKALQALEQAKQRVANEKKNGLLQRAVRQRQAHMGELQSISERLPTL